MYWLKGEGSLVTGSTSAFGRIGGIVFYAEKDDIMKNKKGKKPSK